MIHSISQIMQCLDHVVIHFEMCFSKLIRLALDHNLLMLHLQTLMLGRRNVSEYNPAYRTPCFSDALCIGLHMLHNSALPPASMPLHVLPLLVCLFVSPSRLFPLIDGQWTSAKSDCTCSIRRGLGRSLRSSLLLNSSPRCDPPSTIVY